MSFVGKKNKKGKVTILILINEVNNSQFYDIDNIISNYRVLF